MQESFGCLTEQTAPCQLNRTGPTFPASQMLALEPISNRLVTLMMTVLEMFSSANWAQAIQVLSIFSSVRVMAYKPNPNCLPRELAINTLVHFFLGMETWTAMD